MLTILEHLERFYDEIWKEGKPFIRDFEGVPILEDALVSLSGHTFVLVREEYVRVWEQVQSLRNDAVATGQTMQEGLVVIGHHGIGKSLFLYYALGAALRARIPVVFCNNSFWCHIFGPEGVKEYVFARDQEDSFDVPCGALYLVDSNPYLDSPPPLFLKQGGVLVQTVPPTQRERWEWADRSYRVWFWTMDAWTRAEMHALQRTMEAWSPEPYRGLRGKPGYTPLELFDLLGPCPRQCVHYSSIAKTRAGPQVDLRGCYQPGCIGVFFGIKPFLRAIELCSLPPAFYEDDRIESIFFLYNARQRKLSRVPRFHYTVPTLFLREMLTSHVRSASLQTVSRAAATILASAPSAAVVFYQPLLVEYLLETRAGRFCYVPESDHNRRVTTFRLGPHLVRPHHAIQLHPGCPPIADIEDESILVPWVGFTAFDAIVVSEGKTRATMLRMAVGAAEPDVAGIRAAIDAVDSVLPHPETVRWSFVYAALDGSRAQNLAGSNSNAARMLGGLDPRLKVGWMTIGTLDRSSRALLDTVETELAHDEDSLEERPTKRFKYRE